jgi:putative ATPase
MVYAGEDPRFIFRRMLIFAAEDVGMADPNALRVITAAAQAFDYVGLPEGRFHLAEACLYLATAPKSNSGFAFFDALSVVEQEREAEVPDHLRDGNRDAEDFGHGAGYLYPHSYRDHWVAQQYLPATLQGRVFYQPSEQGYEASIQEQVARRREEQLAAMLEPKLSLEWELEHTGKGPAAQNRWLQRTLSTTGQQLGQIRDKIFALAKVERHDLVLDLNAGTGLLTWEAVRRVPVGGVWALAPDAQTAQLLSQQANNLAHIERPVILAGTITAINWSSLPLEAYQLQAPPLFDVMIGRNTLSRTGDKQQVAEAIARQLKPEGRLVLAEVVPRYTQRLHQLVDLSALPDDLAERVAAAEESIYTNPADPMVNWAEPEVITIFNQTGLFKVETVLETLTAQIQIDQDQLDRWFAEAPAGQRPTFAQHLLKPAAQAALTPAEVAQVRRVFEQQLLNQTVTWQSKIIYLVANKR